MIEDGGIAVERGHIIALGDKRDLLGLFVSKDMDIVDHGDAVLLPSLVNVHCHLEFSFAKDLIPTGLGFAKWLRRAMELKQQWIGNKNEAVKRAAIQALKEVVARGINTLGDVGNGSFGALAIDSLGKDVFCALNFREIIHPLPHDLNLPRLPDLPYGPCRKNTYSPHAVYTCSPDALRKIKDWCRGHGLPFSIHCSESMEEAELVRTARGPLADILAERGRKVDEFFRPARSSVELLHAVGALDPSTICVHCVHVDDRDVRLLSERGCYVCLCPRSNEFIGSGTAPVSRLFSTPGIKVCIGTDSLASNQDLSLFKEMKKLMDMAPDIHPEDIFRAATINGASALGLSGVVGCLEPGALSSFLVLEEGPPSQKEIFAHVCSWPEQSRLIHVRPFQGTDKTKRG